MFIKQAYAQIRPPIDAYTIGDPGTGTAAIIASLWRAVVILGGIALLLYLVWGGLQWVMAGSDKSKVENAQKRIENAVIGMVILAASVAIVYFLQEVIGIDILNPTFTGPGVQP
jgi:hypothetical protein